MMIFLRFAELRMYKGILQASYDVVKHLPKFILVHLRRPDYQAAEILKNLSTGESPQTAAAGVGLQVASTEFDCPKVTLELSPDHCSSEHSFLQPFSEMKLAIILRTWLQLCDWCVLVRRSMFCACALQDHMKPLLQNLHMITAITMYKWCRVGVHCVVSAYRE